MKTKKMLIKISIISIILLLLLSMFNKSYGVLGAIAGTTGVVVILVVGIQYLVLILGLVLETLINAVAALGAGSGGGSIGNIVFNQCPATTPNFFPEIFPSDIFSDNTAVWSLTQTIGQYYSVIRNLAIALLLGILIYIGIRMAISTVAAKEAEYKKMLKNWVVSLILVFVLHFIIIFTLYINNAIVGALYNSIGKDVNAWDYAGIAAGGLVPISGWPNVIIYDAAVVINFIFMFMYLKRIVTLGFLIVIAPLITVTYSIDKMGDGKSQALNTWLKEFIFTVLIQPFHCIIYVVFIRTSYELLANNSWNVTENFGSEILAIVCMIFMLQAEKIIKKIFGIQADSMGDALGAGVAAFGIMQGALKLGKEKKEGASGKKAPKMKSNASATGTSGTANSSRTSSSTNNTSTNTNNNTNNTQSSGTSQQTNATTTSPSNSQAANTSAQANNGKKSEKIDKALKESKFKDEAKKAFMSTAKRMSGEKEDANIAKGLFKTALRGSLVGAAAIAGGTVKGPEGALTMGLAAHTATSNMKSKEIGRYNEQQLEENQQVFAGAYNDFAEEYRRIHGDVSDLDILNAAKDIYDNTGSGVGLDDYELDFYNQMQEMNDTYEALGYEDGWEGIEESIELIQDGEIVPNEYYTPKDYRGSSNSNSTTGNDASEDVVKGFDYWKNQNNGSRNMDEITHAEMGKVRYNKEYQNRYGTKMDEI